MAPRRQTSRKGKAATAFPFAGGVAVVVQQPTRPLFYPGSEELSPPDRYYHSDLDPYQVTKLSKFEDFDLGKSPPKSHTTTYLSPSLKKPPTMPAKKKATPKSTKKVTSKTPSRNTQTKSPGNNKSQTKAPTKETIQTEINSPATESPQMSPEMTSEEEMISDADYMPETTPIPRVKNVPETAPTPKDDKTSETINTPAKPRSNQGESPHVNKLLQTTSSLSKKQRKLKREFLASQRPDQDDEFFPGTTLRFLPDKLRIRIDPARGWDLQVTSDGPPQPPKFKEPTPPETLVGFATDNLEPMRRSNKAGDVKETYCANEGVYLRIKAKFPFFEFHDSLGRHISEENIRYDLAFSTHEQRIEYAVDMIDKFRFQLQEAETVFLRRLQNWRINRRTTEQRIAEAEWHSGNTIIFDPKTQNQDLVDSYNYVVEQNQKDRDGEIDPWFTGRQRPGMIPRDRISKLDIRMYLRNEEIEDANVREELQKRLLELKAPDSVISTAGISSPYKKRPVTIEPESESPSPPSSPTPAPRTRTRKRNTPAASPSHEDTVKAQPHPAAKRKLSCLTANEPKRIKTEEVTETPRRSSRLNQQTEKATQAAKETPSTRTTLSAKKFLGTRETIPWKIMREVEKSLKYPKCSTDPKLHHVYDKKLRDYLLIRNFRFHREMARQHLSSHLEKEKVELRLGEKDWNEFLENTARRCVNEAVQVKHEDKSWEDILQQMELIPPQVHKATDQPFKTEDGQETTALTTGSPRPVTDVGELMTPLDAMHQVDREILYPIYPSDPKDRAQFSVQKLEFEEKKWTRFHTIMATNYIRPSLGSEGAEARVKEKDFQDFFRRAAKYAIRITREDENWKTVLKRLSLEHPPILKPSSSSSSDAKPDTPSGSNPQGTPKSAMRKGRSSAKKARVTFAEEQSHEPPTEDKNQISFTTIWNEVQAMHPEPSTPRTSTPDTKRQLEKTKARVRSQRFHDFYKRVATEDLRSEIGEKAEQRIQDPDYQQLFQQLAHAMEERVLFDENDSWDSILRDANVQKPQPHNPMTQLESFVRRHLSDEQSGRLWRRWGRMSDYMQGVLLEKSPEQTLAEFGFLGGIPSEDNLPARIDHADPEDIDSDYDEGENMMQEDLNTLRKNVTHMTKPPERQLQFVQVHGNDPYWWNREFQMSCQLQRKMGKQLCYNFSGDAIGGHWPAVVDLALTDLERATKLKGDIALAYHVNRMIQEDYITAFHKIFSATAAWGTSPMNDKTIAKLEWLELTAMLRIESPDRDIANFYSDLLNEEQ